MCDVVNENLKFYSTFSKRVVVVFSPSVYTLLNFVLEELVLIVKVFVSVLNSVESLKSVVTSMKGEISKFDNLGNKKLAYPIKKEVTGTYYVMYFEATREVVAELDRKARIDESILRHLIIKLDEE